MNFVKNFLKGICIGSGAILPGISSGVLCVIFGIYDKLVESVLGIFHDFKKNFLYLLPFLIGSFIGIFILGNALNFLFNNFPMPTQYAFIGLILGSIPLLINKINSNRTFKLHFLIYTIISFAIGLFMVILEKYISFSNVTSSNAELVNCLYSGSTLSLYAILLLVLARIFHVYWHCSSWH